MLKRFFEKLDKKTAVIGVVGLGYVGLPLMLRYVEVGFNVVGFDVDQNKVDMLNNGSSYIKHIAADKIKDAVESNMFQATTDFSLAESVDVFLVCVPTPLNKYREPDLTYVISTIDALVPHLQKGQALCLESTTYPGTTEEELKPRIESRGFTIGSDFFLIYSPEREDPANPDFTTSTIPKVCGADTKQCQQAGVLLYEQVIDKVVAVSSTKAAEMTKLLENIYRAVNIGLVNELKVVAEQMNIDIWEVIDAAATKPFGFTPFYPGPGLGGHCIPIDPFYLTWKAREYGLHTRFIELAGEVNQAMPEYVVAKVSDALNDHGKPLKGSKILILGIAYKKNVDDMRESPSVELMQLLKNKGVDVSYSDPYVPVFPPMRDYSFDLQSVEVNESILEQYDCVLVATNHDDFDYKMIKKCAKIIVDTRGIYRGKNSNVVTA